MKNTYKKISTVFHDLGFFDGCCYLFDRVLCRVSTGRIRIFRYNIVVQPVMERPFCPLSKGRNILVREAFPGDKLEGCFPVGREVLTERYAQGGRCLIAEKNGDFVGYLWFIKGRYVEDEVRVIFRLPDKKCVWDFDVYIEPKYRIGFAFLRLWDELYNNLNREGVGYSYSRISAFNSVSRNAHKRLGTQILCHASFIKIGDVQLMFAGASPYVNVSLARSSTPILQLFQL